MATIRSTVSLATSGLQIESTEAVLGEFGGGRYLLPGACERLGAQAVEACCRRDVSGDAVGQRSGTLVLGVLTDLAAVAVVGGERQVGVEVSLLEVERPVGVFEDLKGAEGESL